MSRKFKNRFPKWLIDVIKFLKSFFGLRNSLYLATLSLSYISKKPKTLEAKIKYKMVHDRNPIRTIFADKVLVRNLVAKKIGEKYLTTVYNIFENAERIFELSYPQNFVLKPNHASGALVLSWDKLPRNSKIGHTDNKIDWEKYFIHPDDLNFQDLHLLANKWLSQNYYWNRGRYPEWAYKNISPRILMEELLLLNDDLPNDYKFVMINGKCRFIQVDVSRHFKHMRCLFNPKWEIIDARTTHDNVPYEISRPNHLEEMLSIAQELSSDIDFIRVDLYETDKGIKFGELTNYPNGGFREIWPKNKSKELALDWKLNR